VAKVPAENTVVVDRLQNVVLNFEFDCRQRKINENMLKMPTWIEKYKQQMEQKTITKPKKDIVIVEKIPTIKFLMKPSHPQLINYVGQPKDQKGIEIVRAKASFSKKKKK